MSNKWALNLLAVGSLATGFSLVMAGEAQAQVTTQNARDAIRQVRQYVRDLQEDNELGQVTSVSEFVDVKPTDWAFQALQSLVERYGCIVGLPTKPPTYQGRRATTRYEFAAGLNACLDRINELIASATENLVTKEDMKLIQRLQEEFAAELALLRGRVDTLESRTATLEAQQFSTTTKLTGQAIFSVQGAFGTRDRAVPRGVPQGSLNSVQDAVTFGYRVNLTFNTSFTGKDLLVTNLQVNDVPFGVAPTTNAFVATGTNSASLSYGFLNGPAGGGVNLTFLSYTFPVLADKGKIAITATGGGVNDIVDTLGPLNDDGQGALSGFGLRNPIYNQNGALGVGAAFAVNFLDDKLNFSLGYLANGAGSLGAYSPDSGLFGSSYVAYAQLTGYPLDNLGLGLLYVRGYSDPAFPLNLGGFVGTQSVDALTAAARVSADNLGFQFKWQPLKNFILGGWFGATWFRDEERGFDANGTALNYALAFAFPDVGTRGSQAQIVVGAPPYLSGSSGLVANGFVNRRSDDVPILLEASYRFKFSEYLSITPGIIAIFNPEGNRENETVLVGAIRTTFSF